MFGCVVFFFELAWISPCDIVYLCIFLKKHLFLILKHPAIPRVLYSFITESV